MKKIWITWEKQRRSIELAKAFDCSLYIFDLKGIGRYPLSLIKTIAVIHRVKPDVIFVQNPSMILAAVAVIYRLFCRKKLIAVDRHTTFRLSKKFSLSPRNLIFYILNDFTLRHADLTIVTNVFLADIVHEKGGTAFVLPDKIPALKNHWKDLHLGRDYKNLLLISSFAPDEPIGEVFEAMRMLDNLDIHLYITGNKAKLPKTLLSKKPDNITLTGFLSESEFTAFLYETDGILVLTTAENCMLCGCYEAVAAQTPLITSKKQVLEDYFKGALFVENTKEGIRSGIIDLLDNYDAYQERITALKKELEADWAVKFDSISTYIKSEKDIEP